MFDLEGKKALLTGATGGLGQAMARALHAAGAQVVVTGTRKEVLEELAAALGSGVIANAANLGDAAGITELAKAAEKAMNGLDILVNNAGITRDNITMRMKDEDWDDVMRVNLDATFRLTRAVLRPMMKARWGRIINISSVVGTTGNAGQTNYAASKAGIEGFSKSLAQEVARRNITVNCLAPGFIGTPMTEALSEQQKERILGAIPAGRLGTPDDVAAGVVFLASEEAAYITGQTLHINGGLAMI
jgi:3-oxoacyl-[acyl-carrier protein] reductase